MSEAEKRLDELLEIQSMVSGHIARCEQDTIRTIADEFKALKAENARLKAENERLRAALKPFTDVRDQSPEGIKLISKKFPGFSPVSVTVTKDQWREAIDAARSPS